MNNVVLVGKIEDIKSEKQIITLSVPRWFKNTDGIYESDYIKCKIFYPVLDNVSIGNVVGVKGRLQCTDSENLELIAEKVTFLAPKEKQ